MEGMDGFFGSFSNFFFRLKDLTWEHCLTFGLKVNFSGSHINVCIRRTQERPSQNEGRLGIDFHVEYDEVNGNEEIPDSHQDIFCYSRGIADR